MLLIIPLSFPHVSHALFLSPSLLQLSLFQNISKYPIWILHKIYFSHNIQFFNTINYSSFISSCFLILSPTSFVHYTSLSSSFADRAEEVPLLTQTPPGVVHEGGVAGEETQEEEQGK